MWRGSEGGVVAVVVEAQAGEELRLRRDLIGVDEPVPVLDGRLVPYVNLDNAASTPAFCEVTAAIERFLPYYASVHRGTGYMSRLSTAAYERARQIVGQFVGADPERDVVLFGKNTTEALNKLARSLRMAPDSIVLTTMLEHHSNDLPWRARTRTVRVGALPDGTLDQDDLDRQLAAHAGRVALLVVAGASNVTGVVQPVHRLAEKVHAAGGQILVDAAQLAAHLPIDMRAHDDPGHIDFVALSAHKMYAPFGTGALVGPRDRFAASPDHSGGGTIHAVTIERARHGGMSSTPGRPGMVRISFGFNDTTDVDRAVDRRPRRRRPDQHRDRRTALRLSRRTVESHLGRVYAKLDLSTRAQLVAAAVRRRDDTHA